MDAGVLAVVVLVAGNNTRTAHSQHTQLFGFLSSLVLGSRKFGATTTHDTIANDPFLSGSWREYSKREWLAVLSGTIGSAVAITLGGELFDVVQLDASMKRSLTYAMFVFFGILAVASGWVLLMLPALASGLFLAGVDARTLSNLDKAIVIGTVVSAGWIFADHDSSALRVRILQALLLLAALVAINEIAKLGIQIDAPPKL